MQKLKVEIMINAGLQKVWKYWNDPKSIVGWAFASSDWECSYAENDLIVGGRFLMRMSAKDGSASFDFIGTYVEIIEFQKIIYQMEKLDNDENSRKCEISFIDMGNGTVRVVEEFDPENINSFEMQIAGWQAILENFKKYTEEN